MKEAELIDLVREYGSPVNAALATGRTQEMIACYEGLIEEDQNFIQNDPDAFSKIITQDAITKTREVIDKLRLLV